MVGNELHPMMPFYMNKHMFFNFLPFNFFISGLTLCYQLTTFVNVVVVDPILTNLVLCVVSSYGVATTMDVQVKEKLYQNQHLMNAGFLFAIKLFSYWHQQVDNFFHKCVNMVCLTKSTSCPPLVVLHVFYKQRVLLVL
jgi:hypothetical protein